MRKAAFILALLFMFNLFAVSVSAQELSVSIVYPENASQYKSGENVVITGTCSVGKDLVLRVYDSKDSLVYTDIIPAYENSEGKYTFEEFPAMGNSSKNAVTYKVVVSETGGNIEEAAFTVAKGSSSSGGSGGGGSVITDETKTITWVPQDNSTSEDNIGWGDKEIPAPIDPQNPGGQNKELWETVNSINTVKNAVSAIASITRATDKEILKYETARNNVAVAGEVMTANISAKTVRAGKSNKLSLNTSSVTDKDIIGLNETMAAIEKAISDNDILLNRELSRELVINVNFNSSRTAEIVISNALINKIKDVDALTVKDNDFQISYGISELKEMLGDKEEVAVKIDKSELNENTKKIAVNFDTETTKSVKIAFPGLAEDTKYMAIVDESGNPVGGRYNPATGVLEAKITYSGVYQIVNNEKNFSDIKDKSEEMQESIKILAAKGIIEGTSKTEFSPDDTITRAEVAALLLRVLSEVDANADGGFIDVKQSDWYFGVAGSSKKYGMMQGFEDNSFRGGAVISKAQILTVASRILQKEMNYKKPEDLSSWLKYSDSAEIAEWAQEGIGLATMANIVTRSEDNLIRSDEEMTRGDAALIIMRLFYKIW